MNNSLLVFFDSNPNLILLILVILVTGLLMFSIHYARTHFFRFIKKKPSSLKRIIKLEQPLLIIIFILGVQTVVNSFLKDYARIHSSLNNFLISLSIVIVAYMLSVISAIILDNWSSRLKRTRHDETHEGIVPLLKSVVNILLGFIGLIFILQAWSVSVGALLTSLGIAGVILGFAFRDTLMNVFGGISLILDDTFRKGDLIELDNGDIGYVLETSLRSTKLKTFQLIEIYVPNSVLANARIKNYAQPNKYIRVDIDIPVAIGTDLKKVRKLVFDFLDTRHNILKYPRPKFFFIKVNEYALDLKIGFFINDYQDLYSMHTEVGIEIYDLFLKNNIEIPVPLRKIVNSKVKQSRRVSKK